MKAPAFARTLGRFRRVGLDTSTIIYHLEDVEPFGGLTEVLFGLLASGSLSAVLSTVAVTELLAKPLSADQSDRANAVERFLHSFPSLTLVPPGYAIAMAAARLRGRYGIRTPDALLVATAVEEKAEAFITNDTRLRKLKDEGISIVVLDDFV